MDILERINIYNINPDLIIQIFLVGVLIFYNLYALLVTKQSAIINKSIKTPDAPLINSLALIHLTFGLILLAIAVLVLLF